MKQIELLNRIRTITTKGFIIPCLFVCSQLIAQTAVNDNFSTHINKAITINPLSNDVGCSNCNLSVIAQPKNGTLSAINADGSFTYTPNTNFTGKDSLQYSITSDNGWCYLIVTPLPDNVKEKGDCYFSPKAAWGIQESNSSKDIAYLCAQPLVGDIDNDGENEVIVAGYSGSSDFRYSDSIIIYNSKLEREYAIKLPSIMVLNGGVPIAIADVDKDGIAEIIVYTYAEGLICYNYNGINIKIKWICDYAWNEGESANLVIADIDADGIPEILLADQIYNAQTGEIRAILPNSVGKESVYYGAGDGSMPLFADVDNDGLLEVVGGNTVIKPNIKGKYWIDNDPYVWKTITEPNTGDGFTSVADIDLDGYLDVIVVRKGFMYIWKPYTGIDSEPSVLDIVSYDPSNLKNDILNCGSRALVADIDNDGYPEIVWTYSLVIHACKYNPLTKKLETFWQKETTDTSGSTGITVFDFNQDGKNEIVYRDETHLRIIDGITGENISAIPCRSSTGLEYPVVVDLNKDGAAEIIVSETVNDSLKEGRLRSFTSQTGVKWAQARSVWNQYSYNVVHINENLTVPQYQFNPITTFVNPNNPSATYRPFNNYLQQTVTMNQYAESFSSVPDIVLERSKIAYNLCDSLKVELFLFNKGDFHLSLPFYVSTYKIVDNDIQNYHDNIIRVDTITKVLLPKTRTSIILKYGFDELNNFAPLSDLFFVVNDAGYGIAQNGNLQIECDTLNNIHINTFTLNNIIKSKISYIKDSVCEDMPYTKNGFNLSEYYAITPGTFNYKRTITSSNGCDSTINLKLTIKPKIRNEIEKEVCGKYQWNEQVYHESGNYTQHFISSNGCDSIVNLKLTITPIISEIQLKSCIEYEWNGIRHDKSGNYTQHFISSNGCDSIVILDLAIHKEYSTNFFIETCYPYQWNEETYSESGEYTQHLKTTHGCDSTVNLDLRIVKPAIKIENVTADFCDGYKGSLLANANTKNILWNTGDTSNILSITQPGTYWVKATVDDCIAYDKFTFEHCDFIFFIPSAMIVSSNINNYFKLIFKTAPPIKNFEIVIFNRWGNKVFQSNDIYFRWDGKYKGQLYANTSYQYIIRYRSSAGKDYSRTGTITVLE